MVFYRKYRPQKIDDLDNAAVRETLSSVLKQSTTHAFLFTGPKGLGKTSTARIIAKVVNCTDKKKGEVEPCNSCEQCVSITNGSNMDVLEIDAASNRGIDEIRDLKEKIRLSPVSAKMKVYIIDEVHMLTTEAFNALLKTLEEPPSHAMFILCTTEPHKVPQTIMSRCSHIAFSLATTEELVRSFKRIMKEENITVDDDALEMIAELADGGFRDGVKILEEIVSISNGEKITKELVEKKYKVSSILYLVSSMLDVLIKKDTKSGLEIVKELGEKGIDIKYFIQQLMEQLHGSLLVKMSIPNTKHQILNTELEIDDIRVLFELLTKANSEIKTAVLPQLPLELAIIDYTRDGKVEIEEANVLTIQKETGVTVSSLRKQVGTIKKIQALYGDKSKSDVVEKEEIPTTRVELMHASPNGDVTREWMDAFWMQLISEMKQYNHTIAGLLRGCTIKSFDKKTLVIQTSYKFHKERLDDMKTRTELVKASKLLTGNDVEVKVELRT